MVRKLAIIFILVLLLSSCKGKTKKIETGSLTSEEELTMKIIDKGNIISFELYQGNDLIDSLKESIPKEDSNNNETSCSIDYIKGSFKIIDLNNDSYPEVVYLFHRYLNKTEQLPKSLKAILFDTKQYRRYFVYGIGVNKFDELTLNNPQGKITDISSDIPSSFSNGLKSIWKEYSFEHKIANKKLYSNVTIVSSEKKNSLNNKSDLELSKSKPISIKHANFEGDDKEYFKIYLENGKTLKFENPSFQTSYHYIEVEENSIIKIKNLDDNRSFVETFWYYDNNLETLKMFKAYAESYDEGETTKYELKGLYYNIKTIDTEKFYDEIYNNENTISTRSSL
ncbi:hypothetical protein [Tenacibaculum maritimum]|uniref:hypothetical protein n=3 Tax=Tenacibaculum maritimum TaxID=107401 RepID=UPI0010A43D93|nr:hypothetical protein [Tenacibaculum maritimum]QCD62451.1 hypothetical protein B9C57_07800 [Tenacibaculum maritimum]CAA0219601.1 Probable lipoprotein precursor [Tenacibaculum maritimum]CAA0237981.1 Probable lipoprotein precursor [Tenacibaculum maritimum]